MTNKSESIDNIQWHPGFYGGIELEFIKYKGELIFEQEHNLSKEPLRMDLLIIKKNQDVEIEDEIGRIFKRWNIVEYKSPSASLSIDDLYKSVAYAFLYKGLSETVNAIPAEELTVSIFRDTCPNELFETLKRSGAQIEEKYPGIYYVTGIVHIPVQIVVTRQLGNGHAALKILSHNAKAEDIQCFIEQAEKYQEPGDRSNIDAVLQVSISANYELYETIRRNGTMCEALYELMRDKIEESEARGKAEGKAEGMDMINILNIRLINENRMEDLKRAASDKDYQRKLLAELELLKN